VPKNGGNLEKLETQSFTCKCLVIGKVNNAYEVFEVL
jgi:hypothetical protein